MSGEYKEGLPFGKGDLIVSKNAYKIQFYFSGPDMRYNGTLITIDKNQIDSYVDAYKKNWQKYLNLKLIKAELGNEFSTTGVLGMKIRIGGFFDGICIDSHHMPIRTDKDLNQLIESFLWAKHNGPKIMIFLNSL